MLHVWIFESTNQMGRIRRHSDLEHCVVRENNQFYFINRILYLGAVLNIHLWILNNNIFFLLFFLVQLFSLWIDRPPTRPTGYAQKYDSLFLSHLHSFIFNRTFCFQRLWLGCAAWRATGAPWWQSNKPLVRRGRPAVPVNDRYTGYVHRGTAGRRRACFSPHQAATGPQVTARFTVLGPEVRYPETILGVDSRLGQVRSVPTAVGWDMNRNLKQTSWQNSADVALRGRVDVVISES